MVSWQEKEWLTLSEVAQILGVHPSTVRIWANEGKIPVYRTRGGHRRFKQSEIRLWLQAKAPSPTPDIPRAVIQAMTRQVRSRITEGVLAQQQWYQQLDEEARARYRKTGQELAQHLWAYLTHEEESEEPEVLGYEFANQARHAGLSLAEAMAAFLFFAGATMDGVLEVVSESQVQNGSFWVPLFQKVKVFLHRAFLSMLETHQAYTNGLP